MTIGERISDLRRNRGLTQEQLGDAVGVSAQAVSKWDAIYFRSILHII